MNKLIEKIQIGKYKVRADLLNKYLQSVKDIGFDTSNCHRTLQSLDQVRSHNHSRIVLSLGILGKADKIAKLQNDSVLGRMDYFSEDARILKRKWIKKQKEVREFANDLANWIEKKYIKAEKREKYKARGYGL